MELKKLALAILISFLIIVIAGVSLTSDSLRTMAGGYWELIEIAIILILPAAPVVYGCITKDKIAAMIIGTVPMAGIIFYGMLSSGTSYNPHTVVQSIAYLGSLSTVGGLEGYFASKDELKHILIAIGFGILWICILITGIN